MKRGLRIKEVAKERGITLLAIAKSLGIHRSNMSAIASGSRGISLEVLKRISNILDCSIDELIMPKQHPPLFKNKKLDLSLDSIEKNNADGMDKTWVDRVMLAQNMHYRAVKRFK